MNSNLAIGLIRLIDFIRANPLLSAVFLVWSFYWKGRALWKAAKNNSLAWFVVLLVVNTVGILEILYIYVFGKSQKPAAARRGKK
ncbi:DUF5652 family protein [Patescibacteria group bacterium]|nr:DUF5652 family protein [Patescibacteria group bacterium]